MKIVDAIKFFLLGVKKKLFRNIISILLITIFSLFSLVSIMLYTYKSNIPLSSYQNQYKHPYLVLKENKLYQDSILEWHSNRVAFGKYLKNKISDIFGEKHITPVLSYSTINYKNINSEVKMVVINNQNNIEPLKILGKTPQKSNEILITDYLLEQLNIPDDYTSEKIRLNGIEMYIVGIIQTDFIEYNINKKLIEGLDEHATYKLEYEYQITIVNNQFVEQQIKDSNFIELSNSSILYTDWQSRYLSISSSYSSTDNVDDTDLLFGRMPTHSDEILISESLYENIKLRQQILGEFEMINDTFIDIYKPEYNYVYSDMLNIFDFFKDGFKIVGVFGATKTEFDYLPEVLMMPDVFSNIKESYYNTYQFDEYFIFTNDGVSADVFSVMKSNNLYWTEPSAQIMYEFDTSLHKLDIYIIIVVILVFAAILFLLISLISYSIKDQSKTLGILRALGFTKKDTLKIFILESIIISFVSLCFSIIFMYVFLDFANYNFSKTISGFKFDVLYFKEKLLILYIVIFPVLSIAASFLPIIKLSYKKPYDLINS